ncbi:hypothetical protein [Streptomyces sp. NPDC127197]|uniref:hypothetical protein n=1 Tax=Streptomyces sp. NPDC127197 TaxID=3345388 RepID=UPI0036327078
MKRSVATGAKACVSAVALLAASLGLGVATGGPASAATCYGGAVKFTKYIDHSFSEVFTTSSACQDINLKMTYGGGTSREVRVCFYHSNDTLNYCQSSYKVAYVDQWKVIASDVKDNVKYRYQFKTSGSVTAYTAD